MTFLLHHISNYCYNFSNQAGSEWITSRHQGGLLYKTHLTATVFKDFSSCYQHFTSQKAKSPDEAFVYVDADGVKLLTGVVDDLNAASDGIFALSVAQDGFVEMLTLHEAG